MFMCVCVCAYLPRCIVTVCGFRSCVVGSGVYAAQVYALLSAVQQLLLLLLQRLLQLLLLLTAALLRSATLVVASGVKVSH